MKNSLICLQERFDSEPLPQARISGAQSNSVQVPFTGAYSMPQRTFVQTDSRNRENFGFGLGIAFQFWSYLTLNYDSLISEPTCPSVVASFLGRIESIRQDGAFVRLRNEATGEYLESRCDLEIVRESNLQKGDEFRLEVLRAGNTTSTRISRLPPKPISREEMEAARKSFETRWDFSPS